VTRLSAPQNYWYYHLWHPLDHVESALSIGPAVPILQKGPPLYVLIHERYRCETGVAVMWRAADRHHHMAKVVQQATQLLKPRRCPCVPPVVPLLLGRVCTLPSPHRNPQSLKADRHFETNGWWVCCAFWNSVCMACVATRPPCVWPCLLWWRLLTCCACRCLLLPPRFYVEDAVSNIMKNRYVITMPLMGMPVSFLFATEAA
jgi:hypothetical protein